MKTALISLKRYLLPNSILNLRFLDYCILFVFYDARAPVVIRFIPSQPPMDPEWSQLLFFIGGPGLSSCFQTSCLCAEIHYIWSWHLSFSHPSLHWLLPSDSWLKSLRLRLSILTRPSLSSCVVSWSLTGSWFLDGCWPLPYLDCSQSSSCFTQGLSQETQSAAFKTPQSSFQCSELGSQTCVAEAFIIHAPYIRHEESFP